MHTSAFLHELLSPVMHKKRLKTLSMLVETGLRYKVLSVVKLGRGLELPIKPTSGIKRVDRLIGNEHLHEERLAIYKAVAHSILGDNLRPVVIVDWSNVPNTTHNFLRASIVCEGRAQTLWEEVHDESKCGTAKVHRRFLYTLRKILPVGSCPTLITDAGFYNKWFKEVLKLDWNYVGRVRGWQRYQLYSGSEWLSYQNLLTKKVCKAISYGAGKLCKENTLNTNFYFIKHKSKGRKSLTREGHKRHDKHALEKRRAGSEPWLLVSSLQIHAEQVVWMYKQRMQIEESFRDLKSSRYGLGLEHAYSKKKKRIEILLLVGMLISLVANLVGFIAEFCGLHYDFQTNSTKSRRVLSLFYLGCEVVRKKIKIPIDTMRTCLRLMEKQLC